MDRPYLSYIDRRVAPSPRRADSEWENMRFYGASFASAAILAETRYIGRVPPERGIGHLWRPIVFMSAILT